MPVPARVVGTEVAHCKSGVLDLCGPKRRLSRSAAGCSVKSIGAVDKVYRHLTDPIHGCLHTPQAGSVYRALLIHWESASTLHRGRAGRLWRGIGGWPAGHNSQLQWPCHCGKDVRRRIEGDIGSGPLLTEVLFGRIQSGLPQRPRP
jgi:hypothetical protein